MAIDAINSEEKAKLIKLVDEGCSVLQEVDDLKGGLKDTVKAIAEELDIKPAVLKKAIAKQTIEKILKTDFPFPLLRNQCSIETNWLCIASNDLVLNTPSERADCICLIDCCNSSRISITL